MAALKFKLLQEWIVDSVVRVVPVSMVCIMSYSITWKKKSVSMLHALLLELLMLLLKILLNYHNQVVNLPNN